MSQQQSRLEGRVDELEAKLDAAFKRIERLEEKSSGSANPAADSTALDHYDAAVIDQLDDGDTVTVSTLRELYQTHTRIRSGSKIKNRIKALTNQPEFHSRGTGWVYQTGSGGDTRE